jgi:uncharacterized phage protein (TIGR01671 family)
MGWQTNDLQNFFFDINWYTDSFNGKCVGVAITDDINYLHVMDFINLQDKNGKEIYEGDILKRKSGIGYVFFDTCGYAIRNIENRSVHYLFSVYKLEWEVIGNIYENKDLLK